MGEEGETAFRLRKSNLGWAGLTSSPGLVLGWSLGCRSAVWDGQRALVSRSHRQGWVALSTRGSAAGSDGAHLVVSRKRSSFRFGLRKTRHSY